MKKVIDSFLESLDTPVVQGFAFALWSVPLYFFLDLQLTPTDYDNITKFIEWFGVPYGLIMALVLVNVWTQFDTTDRAFDREADAILTLYNSFLLISRKPLKIATGEKFIKYIQLVRKTYSDEYENNETKIENYKESVEYELLTEIRKAIGTLLNNKKDHDLAITLLQLLNELVVDRGNRLSYSKQRMPSPVLRLSIIASMVWLAPFFALQFSNPVIGAFFIVAVTLIVVSVLLIIMDLDNPIGGTWGVNLDSWDQLDKEIQKEHKSLTQVKITK